TAQGCLSAVRRHSSLTPFRWADRKLSKAAERLGARKPLRSAVVHERGGAFENHIAAFGRGVEPLREIFPAAEVHFGDGVGLERLARELLLHEVLPVRPDSRAMAAYLGRMFIAIFCLELHAADAGLGIGKYHQLEAGNFAGLRVQ